MPFSVPFQGAAKARAHAAAKGSLVVALPKMKLFLVIPPGSEEIDFQHWFYFSVPDVSTCPKWSGYKCKWRKNDFCHPDLPVLSETRSVLSIVRYTGISYGSYRAHTTSINSAKEDIQISQNTKSVKGGYSVLRSKGKYRPPLFDSLTTYKPGNLKEI